MKKIVSSLSPFRKFLFQHKTDTHSSFALSETQILLISGLLVGIGSGLGAVVFRDLIAACTYFFFKILLPFLSLGVGKYAIILIPAIGGLIFGPIIYIFAREAKGHGVPEVMLAVAQSGGKIRPIVAAIKSLASAICIGSGGSVGREGPIVQIGSALCSTLGQVFKMSESRTKLLVACGAAGGIAATFNAPIAGVFFALEVILGGFSTSAFGVVVISSVTASIIGRMAFGNIPAFPLPSYKMLTAPELPFYAILGICGAFGGVWFTKILYWFEDRFDSIKMPEYLKPLPGGLLLGALGLFFPQIFGVGYPAMSVALAGHYALSILAILVIAKVLAVSLTLGSGGSGGVFAPSLFVGSMFGEAFGVFLQRMFPTLVTHPANFGLVGMAAFFAGAARAPITAIIILFELTGDYAVILPLMAAVVISTIVADALSKETIYTLKLKRRGIDLSLSRNNELMKKLRVREAMNTKLLVLPNTLTVEKALTKLKKSSQHAILVEDKVGKLIGILTMQELEEAILNKQQTKRLDRLVTTIPTAIFADESLEEAVRRMGISDQESLPVLNSNEDSHPIGIINQDNVFQTYSLALLEEQSR